MPFLEKGVEVQQYADIANVSPFEPIAIVGIGCRWPGELTEPRDLWDFLQGGREAYTDFPADRINIDAFYHEKRDRPGSFCTRGGCFLKSPKDFDHTFFGINPQEAMSIDPAQRKLLETVYEAFESSGATLEHLSGSATGCFVGNFNYDHQLMQYREPEYPEAYGISGGGLSMLSNRVNYIFNLNGPSMTLDTACSSSLYALHLACQAIHSGDCSAAVVAASNLILTPECQLFSSALGTVSPTSKCHTFDAAADGYARADGVGAFYIKRLSSAIANKDPIRAVIRGTSTNANGKTGGITRPSSDGQESAIRLAYERAGVDFSATGYFECHGTGTPVGDPLEVAAIARVFGSNRSKKNPLLLGSVKPNLGHCEPVSGLAGLMKVILAMENNSIPPTIGITTLNPALDLRDGSLKVVTKSTPWPTCGQQIASVSSFGYGGSNSHVVLESASSYFHNVIPTQKPYSDLNYAVSRKTSRTYADGAQSAQNHISSKLAPTLHPRFSEDLREKFLLVFSAHNANTLTKNMDAVAAICHEYEAIDLAHTLGVRRSNLPEKSFIVTSNKNMKGVFSEKRMTVHGVKGSHACKVGFIFSGQGTQWAQMGEDLMMSFPSFRRCLRTLNSYLQSLEKPPTWNIENEILQPAVTSAVNQAYLSQPLITAIQIALIDLLASWRVVPAIVLGHSSGEIAAAYGAGLLTAKEAIIIAYLRGTTVSRNPKEGAMLAVGLDEQRFKNAMQHGFSSVTIACFNSPSSITLSGDVDEILATKDILERKNVFTRILSTGGNAYHSPHMTNLGEEYENVISKHCPELSNPAKRSSKIPFVSSVTGDVFSGHCLDAKYWNKNLVFPVKFEQALRKLQEKVPVEIMVEVGPHCALRGPIQQIDQSERSTRFTQYVSTMIRKENSVHNLLNTAGHLWLKNVPLDLGRINAIETVDESRKGCEILKFGSVIADLPRYQWHYEKTNILENRWTREWRLRKHPRHDILGSQVPGLSKSSPVWRNVLRLKDLDWIADHNIGGVTIFPAAGYVAMTIEAAMQVYEDNGGAMDEVEGYDLRDMTIDKALVVPQDDRGVEMFLAIVSTYPQALNDETAGYRFLISSVSSQNNVNRSTNHSSGYVSVVLKNQATQRVNPPTIHSVKAHRVSSTRWYERFNEVGMNFGPRFRLLSEIQAQGSTITAELTTASLFSNESRYVVHPTALDAALQLCVISPHVGQETTFKKPFLPCSIKYASIKPHSEQIPDKHVLVTASGCKSGTRALLSDLTIRNEEGGAVVQATDVLFVSPEENSLVMTPTRMPYSRMLWIPDIDSLTSKSIMKLHPLIYVNDSAILPKLEHLALHQVAQFHEKYPEFYQLKAKVEPHLRRFLDWTSERIALARNGHYPRGHEILDCSLTKRESLIRSLSSSLCEVSSEARVSCHIYENLPAILRGEKSGIQVALEGDRLSAMYKDAQRLVEGNRRLAAMVSLAAQKNPQIDILEIGAGTGSATHEVLNALRGNSILRMYKKYVFTDITPSFLQSAEERFREFRQVTYTTFDMESKLMADASKAAYDLVIASNVVHATSNILNTLRNLRTTLKSGGKMMLLELTEAALNSGLLLGTFSDFWKGEDDPHFPRHGGPFLSKSMWAQVLPQAGFSGLDFSLDDYTEQSSCTVIVATAAEMPENLTISPRRICEFSIVFRSNPPPPSILAFRDYLNSNSIGADLVSLTDNAQPSSKNVIVLAEIDCPILDQMSRAEWTKLQQIVMGVDSVLWVTTGDVFVGREPKLALISGLGRGIKTERTSIKFSILDLDARNLFPSISGHDMDFIHRNGVTYISRLLSDEKLNNEVLFRGESDPVPMSVSLRDLEDTVLHVRTGLSGSLQELLFQETEDDVSLDQCNDFVEIDVRAMGLSHHNVGGILGKIQTTTFRDECAGVIRSIGRNTRGLAVGDAVFCPAFGKCGNRALVRASWCQKMKPGDAYYDMATMSIPFCTVLYALSDLAHLKKGETVLISATTMNTGFAALQIATLYGARVLAAVIDSTEKQMLLDSSNDINPDNVFVLSDNSLVQSINDATNGKGVNVLLTSMASDSIQNYWGCIAPFGRIVNLKRSDAAHSRQAAIVLPNQDISFSTLNIESLSEKRPDVLAQLMDTVQSMRFEGLIKPIPHQVFHASELELAFKYCIERPTSSNVVLSLDKTDEKINYRKMVCQSSFDPGASYLLVGCLGDLGQIFSRWMVQRGARHLTYLSRSGGADEEAKAFLSEIRTRGATVEVVKGDVSCLEDVHRAVRTCKMPIKGVLQGALALNDCLFENLTLEMFNALVRPRVHGTINLDKALEGQPLDFFLMWSSWTAIFGTATQSNYLATCTFMDAFARHRRRLGRPATSLDLSQIFNAGNVRRVAAYERTLTRNGLYGTEENEFIRYCDAAIASSTGEFRSAHSYDPLASAQLLAGIEPVGLKNLNATHPLDEMAWHDDPRFSHLLQATRNLAAEQVPNAAALDVEDSEFDASISPSDRILKRLAQLLYVPKADIDPDRPIVEYGLDSMIAAELRNWLFATFAKNVSIFEMLEAGTSVKTLEDMVVAKTSQ